MSNNLEKEETMGAAACLPDNTDSCVSLVLYTQTLLTPLPTARGAFAKVL